jgi:hypothetical protein
MDNIMKKILLIILLLSSNVNSSFIYQEIKIDELSLLNKIELNDFIKKYTLKSYIKGKITENIFSYNNEQYLKLERKDEKLNVYNINIQKDYEFSFNVPTTIEKYSIIIEKNNTGYESKNLSLAINPEYNYNEISKRLVTFSKENEYNVYLDNIVNLYLMKKKDIDITKSGIIAQSTLSQIIINKKNMIEMNKKINLRICRGVNISSSNKLIYIPESDYSDGFSILFDEVCEIISSPILNSSLENEDINEPWEDEDEKEREGEGEGEGDYTNKDLDEDYINNVIDSAIADFNRNLDTKKIKFDKNISDHYFGLNFDSYNDAFLNIGTYFFEDKKVNYVKKHELLKPYIFIKTKESLITNEFVNFIFKDDCAYLLNYKIEINICNIKNVEEFNNITEYVNIYR